MNITTAVKSALFLATLSLPSLSSALTGSMGNMKVALILNEGQPGLFEREADGDFRLVDGKRVPAFNTMYSPDGGQTQVGEAKTLVKTTRYGNRELMEELLEAGAFPEGVNSIQGWSLKLVSAEATYRTYLYKKGSPSVDVTDAVAMEYTPLSLKSVSKSTVKVGPPNSIKISGSFSTKGVMVLELGGELIDLEVTVDGKGTSAGKGKVIADGTSLVLLENFKSTALVGSMGGGQSLGIMVEGAASVSGTTALEEVRDEFPNFGIKQ